MVGAAESTVSPSSSSTIRSTPCVLGCCGPMLTVITSVLMSGICFPPPARHEGTKAAKITKRIGLSCASCSSCLRDSRAFEHCYLHQLADHMQQRPVHFLHA